MKNLTHCSIIALLLLFNCKPNNDSENKSEGIKRSLNESLAFPENEMRFLFETKEIVFPEYLSTAVKSEKFSLINTAKLGAFYMNANNSFRNISKVSWGGTFDANAFKLNAPNNAVRLWYCYNPKNKKYPKFFLALEQIEITGDTAKYPESSPAIGNKLIIPEVFPYPTSASTTSIDIQKFIESHDTDVAGKMQLSAAEVLEYSENFRDLISIISPADIGPYCKYMVAIFVSGDPYNEFMAREGGLTFVRYYMGLSYDPTHEPNYLRPVLAGVSADGTTVTGNRTDPEPFLQKSVPPPPYQ